MKLLSKIKNIAVSFVLIYGLFAILLGFDKANEIAMGIVHIFI